MSETISRDSGRAVEQVLLDIDRDRFMTPADAIDYGLIDGIMSARGEPATKAA